MSISNISSVGTRTFLISSHLGSSPGPPSLLPGHLRVRPVVLLSTLNGCDGVHGGFLAELQTPTASAGGRGCILLENAPLRAGVGVGETGLLQSGVAALVETCVESSGRTRRRGDGRSWHCVGRSHR